MCAHLSQVQAEWQRRYDSASESANLTTAADLPWKRYSDDVWRGVHISTCSYRPMHPDDMSGRLRQLQLHATAPDGKAAKVPAILTMEEAGSWCDIRDDSIDLLHSLLRDTAGVEAHGMGVDAAPVVDKEPA